jgi:hypothetical protein
LDNLVVPQSVRKFHTFKQKQMIVTVFKIPPPPPVPTLSNIKAVHDLASCFYDPFSFYLIHTRDNYVQSVSEDIWREETTGIPECRWEASNKINLK